MGSRRTAMLGVAAVVAAAMGPGIAVARAAGHGQPTVLAAGDWPTYGQNPQRTFVGQTTLSTADVASLSQAWFFATADAVTAQPIVAAGSVYVGSWDGNFYALDQATGQLRWKFTLDSQPAVSPQPGNRQPTDVTSDGGMVTASAWFQPGSGGRPDLVIFGGGYTLYALNAADGSLFWKHAYTGRPDLPPNPSGDDTRIFSSPAVVGHTVLFSADADGSTGFRGYLVGADLATGNPLWTRELDVDSSGQVLNDGCGNVWASPSIDEKRGLEYVAVADCKYLGPAPYHERMLAVRIADGTIAWVWTPPRLVDPQGTPDCDWDFGATANLGTDANGNVTFLGVGGKDGTYYSIDPANGQLLWSQNVVFGGFAGGFIGSTAYDAGSNRVYGATALGDFGRFEMQAVPHPCQPGNPRDTSVQEPSVHAFDTSAAASSHLAWESGGVSDTDPVANSFGPTSVAAGMVFVGTGITKEIQIRSAADGSLLRAIHIGPADSDSGVVVSGNALFFGTGTSEYGGPTGVGVYSYTPGGVLPIVAPLALMPEVPLSLLLPLTAVAVIGGVELLRRRRGLTRATHTVTDPSWRLQC
jgi:outer membrane protein assembly factor BamB